MFFGVLCKDENSTINLLPMVMIPILIFGGLAVNINDIPVYIRWFQYLSPLRHAFLILFKDQMDSSNFSQYAGLNLA
jgi:ABC-type multidrug transport system permease subunit